MTKAIKKLFSKEVFMRIVLPIILVIALVIIGWFSFYKPTAKNISQDEAKSQAETFINTYLM